jgi:hypothetical protein
LGVPIIGESSGGEPVQADQVAAGFPDQFAVAEECRFSLAKYPLRSFAALQSILKRRCTSSHVECVPRYDLPVKIRCSSRQRYRISLFSEKPIDFATTCARNVVFIAAS